MLRRRLLALCATAMGLAPAVADAQPWWNERARHREYERWREAEWRRRQRARREWRREAWQEDRERARWEARRRAEARYEWERRTGRR